MKTIYDEIEDQAAGIFAIWSGLHTAAVKNKSGEVDDFRIRGLLDLLRNAGIRLEMFARDNREWASIRNAEKSSP